MKKSIFLSISIALCMQGMAQNAKVSSASMHLVEFASHQDTTELLAAKAAVDEASQNDKTKDEPKMYLYRGEVYYALFNLRFNNIVSKLVAADKNSINKAPDEAYEKIDTSYLCISANSYIRVLQINPKDYYADEARDPQNLWNLPRCVNALEHKTFREFNTKQYPISLALAKKLILLLDLLNNTDTIYKEVIKIAAISADKLGNYPQALSYYQKLIDIKYGETMPYVNLSAMYMNQKDTAKSWEYIEKGRAQYPNDLQLIISETNYYLTKHDFDKAESNLTLSINKLEQSPDKEKNKGLLASLYSNLGSIYDHRANPRDNKGEDLPKPADYKDLIAKAETNYKKALEINPEDFDMLYVLGALYFNQAVPLNKQANELPLNATDKYNKLIAQAKDFFKEAQPYFEHAYKINPKDALNNNALIQVYSSTDQNDKAEAIRNAGK